MKHINGYSEFKKSLCEKSGPCWDGYKIGSPKTKISSKSGKRVNNCVPVDEDVNEAKDSFYIKQLTDTFDKFKLNRKYEITMSSLFGGGSKIAVLRKRNTYGDGAMIDTIHKDGGSNYDGYIQILSSKSGRPIPGKSKFDNIDDAMKAATKYVDSIKESVNENEIKVGDIVYRKFPGEDSSQTFKVISISGRKAKLKDNKTGKQNGMYLSDLVKESVTEGTYNSKNHIGSTSDGQGSNAEIYKKGKGYYVVVSGEADYDFDAKNDKELLKKLKDNEFDSTDILEVNEATDMNDPVLMAFRATRRELPKFKPAKAKSRRLSFDKYMDLLDDQTNIEQDIKDYAEEMAQTFRDMEQEAEPEGGEMADKYGSIMMKQEKEYAKLKAKKAKIDARIEKHRMD